jgi:hypothetical protein
LFQHRPAFNLAVLLWRTRQKLDATELWISWRFREEFSHGKPVLEVCRVLVQEVGSVICLLSRGLFAPLQSLFSQAGARRASLVSNQAPCSTATHSSSAISELQLSFLDLLVLEFKLGTLQIGGGLI